MKFVALGIALLMGSGERNRSVRDEFKRSHPAPSWCATYVVRDGFIRLYDVDGACDVDHCCPIACGGPDTVENMQWLDSKQNRSKGADCSACNKEKLCPSIKPHT